MLTRREDDAFKDNEFDAESADWETWLVGLLRFPGSMGTGQLDIDAPDNVDLLS